jgi:hypothetical protein
LPRAITNHRATLVQYVAANGIEAYLARHGPLSRSPNVRHALTGDTGAYPPEEVAQMAHSLAVKAITSP